MFKSVLIANRGEIAVRIVRACNELGLRAIAVFSEADRQAMHVRLADEARLIGPAAARRSYLDQAAVIAAAKAASAEAIHPGYGMLSENADFARAVAAAGLVFVGPPAEAIAIMGDKLTARAAARACGVPVLAGGDRVSLAGPDAEVLAGQIGFPIAVKACFGGGGRGMRIARRQSELAEALAAAARESDAAFGRAEVYLERYLEGPRHIEVQIVADSHGQVLHLGDRDCSVQRRHQKLIEEAPAPNLPAKLRRQMLEAAVELARSVHYESVGTVEFLVNAQCEDFYFLEMNTRLQVEHAVTELVCGRDLVQLQLHIAAGRPLDFTQRQVRIAGHAMEARIAAEDPWNGFAPRPGRIGVMRQPGGPGVRCDFGVESGDAVPAEYDSMFGKVLAWGGSRDAARLRLRTALKGFAAEGLVTTAPYLAEVLDQPDFAAARFDTTSLERDWPPSGPAPEATQPLAPQTTAPARRVSIATDRGPIEVEICARAARTLAGEPVTSNVSRPRRQHADARKGDADPVSPMDGCVVVVAVSAGDLVAEGDLIATLEAMKMEMPVHAARAGRIERVLVKAGDTLTAGAPLCVLSSTA